MLSLNNIKRSTGATKNRKRVGRGNASGHGTYSTRGLKGQKSRSGVSNLKRLGMRKQLLQTPKVRGFKSLKPKNQIVSISALNTNFKDGDTINPEVLFAKDLIKSVNKPVKVLGKEKLTLKLKFEKVQMSASLQKQLAA
ncbi:MAG: 50S ribosomal protein L15 [Patescibacteria group bacterium]|jgi:large subunit ribosomal protein L15|nr:50S ribosomal protein L15 [Patescibacteria group bacterium]